MTLKDDVLVNLELLEVAPRVALTYMIRTHEQVATRGVARDPGIEKALAQLQKEGKIIKNRVGARIAYCVSKWKKDQQRKIAHDMQASLAGVQDRVETAE